jgi:hypothetical protein
MVHGWVAQLCITPGVAQELMLRDATDEHWFDRLGATGGASVVSLPEHVSPPLRCCPRSLQSRYVRSFTNSDMIQLSRSARRTTDRILPRVDFAWVPIDVCGAA